MKKIHNASVVVNVTEFHIAECDVSDNGIVYKAPERIPGVEEVSRKPVISEGELYGDGTLRIKESKKTSYDLGINANAIPLPVRRYMEGVQAENGVESGTSKDRPNHFAVGWKVEKTNGDVQLVWFLYCMANPIESNVKQSEANTNFSTDTLSIKAMEHDSLKKFYTMIDSEDENVTDEMIENFFTKVQTSSTIEKGTAVETEEGK